MDIVFVLYDGIDHSIFESQVFNPLLKLARTKSYKKINIVSFERNISEKLKQKIAMYETAYPAVSFFVIQRTFFIGSFFLNYEIYKLKKLLKLFKKSYVLYARGPLAGFIAKRAITSFCASITIQARGLLAEEYAYIHKNASYWKKPFIFLRLWQLKSIECHAYKELLILPFYIESVSTALTDYLYSTYNINKNICTEPKYDTPEPITESFKKKWRTIKKNELAIPDSAVVYVYNGSLKPWQCINETMIMFKTIWQQNKRAIFVGLTTEPATLKAMLIAMNLPEEAYHVLSVPAHDILKYLCIADCGFLLREKHILNWVSRPTKLLEYQSVGITIIHNNTIALLAEK